MRSRANFVAIVLTALPTVAGAAAPTTGPAIPYYGFGYQKPAIPVSAGLLPVNGNEQPANPDPDPNLLLEPHDRMRPPGQDPSLGDPPPLYRNFIAPRYRNYNLPTDGNTMRGIGNTMRPTFPNTMQPTSRPASGVPSMTQRPTNGNTMKPTR